MKGSPCDGCEAGCDECEDGCEGCDGSGVRAPAGPMCVLEDRGPEWMIVERCDSCETFPDDLSAALSITPEAEWITCDAGGPHVIARRPPAWQE